MAVVVDALHDKARAFYERYGFQRFPDNVYRLFMPMQTIGQLLAEDDSGSVGRRACSWDLLSAFL